MGEQWGPRGRGGPCSQILDVFVPGKLIRSVNGLDTDVSKRQVWRMIPKDVKLVSGMLQSILSNGRPGKAAECLWRRWGGIFGLISLDMSLIV